MSHQSSDCDPCAREVNGDRRTRQCQPVGMHRSFAVRPAGSSSTSMNSRVHGLVPVPEPGIGTLRLRKTARGRANTLVTGGGGL